MVKKHLDRHTVTCKYCGMPTTIRCGSYRGIYRYYCKPCGRKFKPDDNVYYMRSSSSVISNALNMFYDGARINEIDTALAATDSRPPSKEALYRWIVKYTLAAPSVFREYQPSVGSAWLISKTFFYFIGRVYKMIDVVDISTRFLLASSISLTQDINTIKKVMHQAALNAGKYPSFVLGHMHYSYFNRIKKAFDCEAEHMHNRQSAMEYNVELVQAINAIFKPRLKIMYTLKNTGTVERFVNGWYINYNFFQSQALLGNRTPAAAAGINCHITGWQSLVDHLAQKNYSSPYSRHPAEAGYI